jgi:hypothetical protein
MYRDAGENIKPADKAELLLLAESSDEGGGQNLASWEVVFLFPQGGCLMNLESLSAACPSPDR